MNKNLSIFHWGPTEILFGFGSLDQVSTAVKDTEREGVGRIAIFCGQESMRKQGFLDRLLAQFPAGSIEVFEGIGENPTISSCQEAGDFLARECPSTLIALGGGSVTDTAKMANVAAGVGMPVSELLQRRCADKPLARQAQLFVAIPTTAGTGSEVTPFATVWDFQELRKYSLDDPVARASLAVLDPELTIGIPLSLTLRTASDALAHAMESLWSRRSSPVSSALALYTVRTIVKELPPLVEDLHHTKRREQMLWASLLAGMAIGMTRTAAAHAISYSLTLRFGIPHGLSVGILLPRVLSANQGFLTDGHLDALKNCFGCGEDEDLVEVVENFLADLGILEPLYTYGVTERDIDSIVKESNVPGRMDNNCRPLSESDIVRILKEAL
ncbi:phosphonoacetaldehyde reductase [Acidobacteria bacterium AH-259-D05]|nr:phosphonoacetaldehyde reductase [Acidobacteria bacterium AH-259-D05]